MVCKWSRILNAKMPRPHLFDPDMQLEKAIVTRKVGGKDQKCIHWSQAAVDGSVGPTACPAPPTQPTPNRARPTPSQVTHFYETEGTRTPVLLENDDMTYEFLSFERGGDSTKAALDETYAVPPEFGSDCERVAQDVGFPYIHLLHTFVRF